MELVGSTFFFDWEVALMVWLQARLGAAGAAVASVFSMFGEELACVAVLGFLYWCYDKKFGKYVGLNVLTALVLNPMVKNVFIRRRPYFDHPEIQCLKPVDKSADIYDIAAQGYSFPSGHSANAVTVYSSLPQYKRNKALAVIGVLLPLLVGVSRVCVGAHYPTDVLCGWLLGLAVILVVPVLYRRIKNRLVFYALLLAVTLPGFFYCQSSDYFTGIGMLVGFIAGTEFEERFVNFENTRKPLWCVLRIVGGVAIFFGLNTVLKLPFSKEFLDTGTMAAHLVRTLRYAVVLFVDIALSPMLFKLVEKK